LDRYLGTTKEQRKMARLVAKDIATTRIKVLNVQNGEYCGTPFDLAGHTIQALNPEQLGRCDVCARGAMMLTRAILFDGLVLPRHDDSPTVVKRRTSKDFGKFHSELIEAAFEGNDVQRRRDDPKTGDPLFIAAVKFGNRFRSSRGRLSAIMRNIVENHGVFRPDKALAAKKKAA
jgi:hypothetical protein